MEKSFKSVIDQSKSVLILLPKNPYFDQVAAGLSLSLALEGTKDVAIASTTPMLVEFNRLVGVNKITTELGNKNLVLRFADYDAENIERVSYDVEENQFRLIIIPKPQVTPPKKDQVIVGYSGVSADTIILIGGINDTHFPALSSSELLSARVVHIGIQDFSSSKAKEVISLSKPASSISEIVTSYIKELEDKLTPDVASNLLAGIHEGSRNFSHNLVNADTFKLASELMQAGGKYIPRQDRREPQKSAFPPPRQQIEAQIRAQEQQVQEEVPAPGEALSESADQSPENDKNPPKAWLKPKIYKGTSVS